MQKGSSIVREQKGDVRSDVSQGKLKQESSIVGNCKREVTCTRLGHVLLQGCSA